MKLTSRGNGSGSGSFPLEIPTGERAWKLPSRDADDLPEPNRRSAQPQRVGDKEFFGSHWGVTRQQCVDLLAELRSMVASGEWDEDGNVYEWVQQVIKPRTKGKGMGYALLLNCEDPKEVNTMVSHAWSENAIEFLAAICRSTLEDDVLFICALSILQNEDGVGPCIADQLGDNPKESPFQCVLEHIGANGTEDTCKGFWYKYHYTVDNSWHALGLCILAMVFSPVALDGVVYTFNYSAVKKKVCLSGLSLGSCETIGYVWVWDTIWPLFRLCLPLAIVGILIWGGIGIFLWKIPIFRGRMIVVPNRQIDIYTRLWCVYEIFIARKLDIPVVLARTMANVGASSSAEAHCTSHDDLVRIHKEIISEFGENGFETIDSAIHVLTNELKWDVFRLVWSWGLPLVIVGLGYYNMFDPDDCQKEFWGDSLGLLSVVIGAVFSFYRVFKSGGGVISWRTLAMLAVAQLVLFIGFEIIRLVTKPLKTECDGTFGKHSTSGLALAFIFGYTKAVSTGACVAFLCSFGLLIYTYFDRGPRALERNWKHALAFFCFGVTYCVVREMTAPHGLPRSDWKYPSQALPEAFYVATEFAAVLGLPMNAIWISSLYWGLQVDWVSFDGRTASGRTLTRSENPEDTEETESDDESLLE